MRILVTGFDGYVGSHVVKSLQQRGASISALVRDDRGKAHAGALGIRTVEGLLEEPMTYLEAIEEIDAVGHFAASQNPAFEAINQMAVAAMLAHLTPGKGFVMQGGTMVFGEQSRVSSAAAPVFAPPPMLEGRASLDRMVLEAAGKGIRASVVYGAFVFGGRGAMIPNALAEAALASSQAVYPGHGEAIWSGVHVADWADLIARVLVSEDPGGRPIFAAAQDVRIKDAAEALALSLGGSTKAESVSLEDARLLWPFFADALTIHQRFDPIESERRFGWRPSAHSLDDAFREALDAMRVT